jgi:hypothetical protein
MFVYFCLTYAYNRDLSHITSSLALQGFL